MKNKIAALLLGTALTLAAGNLRFAQDKTVKIGSLSDQSGLYADLGGPGSTLAAQMAVEDSGMTAKGWKIDIISGDHLNKPDVGVNIARQWFDVDKVDVIVDVPNSGVALAVSNIVKEKNGDPAQFGRRELGSDQRAVHAKHHPLGLRHLHAGARHRYGAGEGRRRYLVLPDRRLCLRRRARARHHRGRAGRGRQGRRRRQASARAPRTSRPSCCRRRPRRPRSSVWPMPAAIPPTRSSRRPSSASSRAARSSRRLLLFITDVNSLGLETAQGLNFTETFYWDMNDQTRAFSKRFAASA